MGVYQRGGCWYSQFWFQGVRYRKSWGKIRESLAQEKDGKYRQEIRDGKHTSKGKKIFFEKFTDKYLEQARVNKKPKSAKRNEVSINMLKPHFSGKLLSSITPFMVELYKRTRKEEGTAPATINRDVACLKNMMSKAVDWGYLGANPIGKAVKLFKEDNEKMWALTDQEEKNLLEACSKSPQRGGKGKRYLRDLVLFALHSGMREQEIFGLTKDRVQLGSHFLKVVDTNVGDGENGLKYIRYGSLLIPT